MARPVIDFWYEFASTYSYPAAMIVDDLAAAAGVAVRWRPFLLGPLFKAQGWDTSPFNIYPAKGDYMWRDMARICAARGLALKRPDPFPQNSLLAARVALTTAVTPMRAAYSRAVYEAEFGRGEPIGEPETLARVLAGLGLEADAVLAEAQSEEGKMRLREATDEARGLGIFGAPSMVTADGELFWGHDRLEDALAWACSGGHDIP